MPSVGQGALPDHSRLAPKSLIFWTRALMGVIGGFLAGLMGFTTVNPDAYRGIIVAIAFYMVTYYLARYFFARELPKGQGHKYLTLGIGSYIMLFLFTWILYNTLFGYPA